MEYPAVIKQSEQAICTTWKENLQDILKEEKQGAEHLSCVCGGRTQHVCACSTRPGSIPEATRIWISQVIL